MCPQCKHEKWLHDPKDGCMGNKLRLPEYAKCGCRK